MDLREDTTSGKVRWQERGIGKMLLQEAKKGDVILVAEVSRLARSTLQVLEILEHAAEKAVSVHIVKNREGHERLVAVQARRESRGYKIREVV